MDCELQQKDVSRLFLCSLHFKVSRNLIVQEKWKLPRDIISNIDITDVATNVPKNVLTDSTNIPKSIETSLNISDNINCDFDSTNIKGFSFK